jgi:phospholipid/cholesterol/gamma-HCH transport system substrate-binding protein
MKRRDEVLVGVFVTVAAIVLVVGIIWLTNGGLSNGYPLYTRFAWGQNLKKGHPVLLAGQEVGHVSEVTLKPGYLDVELAIDNDQVVPSRSTVSVVPVGIFGDVAIAINPPLPLPATNYSPGDTIPPGPETPDIGTILRRVDSIGMTISKLTQALDRDLIASGGLRDLRRLIATTTSMSEQLQIVIANQDRNLTATMGDFRRSMTRLSSLIDSAMVDSTMKSVRTGTANMARLLSAVDSTNTEFRTLVAKANNGRGSVGMLLNDTTLYTNVRNLVGTLDSLVNDFKKDPKKYINVKFSVF